MEHEKSQSFHFELVMPDAVMHHSKETAVTVPAVEGETMIKTGHQKMVLNLQHGICRIHKSDRSEIPFYITGGFADITPAHCYVATESAEPVNKIDIEKLSKVRDILAQDLDETEDPIEREKIEYRIAELNTKIDIVSAYEDKDQHI